LSKVSLSRGNFPPFHDGSLVYA